MPHAYERMFFTLTGGTVTLTRMTHRSPWYARLTLANGETVDGGYHDTPLAAVAWAREVIAAAPEPAEAPTKVRL